MDIEKVLIKLFKCLLKDDELETEYHKILSNSSDNGFISKPVYDVIYLNSYVSKIKVRYHGNGMSEKGSGYTFSTILLISLVVKMDKNCYL